MQDDTSIYSKNNTICRIKNRYKEPLISILTARLQLSLHLLKHYSLSFLGNPIQTFSLLSKMRYIYVLASLTALVYAFPAEKRAAPIGCSTCNPLPELNKCDITTSCIYNWGHQGPGGPNYCACRAGYKANPLEVGQDPAAQWRLPWASQEGRVFVRPGVKCDTLCDHYQLGLDGCQEVWLNNNPQCM